MPIYDRKLVLFLITSNLLLVPTTVYAHETSLGLFGFYDGLITAFRNPLVIIGLTLSLPFLSKATKALFLLYGLIFLAGMQIFDLQPNGDWVQILIAAYVITVSVGLYSPKRIQGYIGIILLCVLSGLTGFAYSPEHGDIVENIGYYFGVVSGLSFFLVITFFIYDFFEGRIPEVWLSRGKGILISWCIAISMMFLAIRFVS